MVARQRVGKVLRLFVLIEMFSVGEQVKNENSHEFFLKTDVTVGLAGCPALRRASVSFWRNCV
jgi:hypothetical protein